MEIMHPKYRRAHGSALGACSLRRYPGKPKEKCLGLAPQGKEAMGKGFGKI